VSLRCLQDFDNNDHIILIENENSDNAMTLKLINVEIKSTTGNPDEASTRNSFIKNVGGVVDVEGLIITNARAFQVSTPFSISDIYFLSCSSSHV
jgi:hypothetical protein